MVKLFTIIVESVGHKPEHGCAAVGGVMRQGHASRTAQYMALFRALESSRPEARRLFEDPRAPAFLDWLLSFVLGLARLPRLGKLIPRLIDRRVPGARSSAIARTRFIDDAIEALLGEEMVQVVILGAGFDCRPYRLPILQRTTVFEVDHPDTLRVKRRVLERMLPDRPRHVRFVEVDFNDADLACEMLKSGYEASKRTLVVWEGVTNYLAPGAVDVALRWCSGAARSSQVLFTYVHQGILTRPSTFLGTGRLLRALERFGERWTFGIDPRHLCRFLADRGLLLERDIGATEYRQLYFHDAARAMHGCEFYRIALARVQGAQTC